MDLELEGKTAIVTGGASNIGRAIVLGLAREGAKIVIADIDEIQSRKVVKEAKRVGAVDIWASKTDVTEPKQIQRMVEETLGRFERIDILVNNAGAGHIPCKFIEEDLSIWERTIGLNLRNVLYCTRTVLGPMMRQKSGAIVSIGSDAGRTFEAKGAVYASAKAGVIGLTRSLAFEMGPHGIRLNVICPALTPAKANEVGEMSNWHRKEIQGMMQPEVLEKWAKRYPLRKLGTPEDIANAVLFMVSDRVSGHITGQTLSVNGGSVLI
ncbi:MAG: SDR family oxidoreductase [Dehalococcoidia bacterium]|nr:SDR family oxidoreductase [Dehalococcoidia bacterium]